MELKIGKLYKRIDTPFFVFRRKDDYYSKWDGVKDRVFVLESEQVFMVVSLGSKIDGERQFYQILCEDRIGWIIWCDYWEGMKEVK